MSDNSLQDQVDALNDSGDEELRGRSIKLFVDSVGTKVPPARHYKEKRVSLRVVEMNRNSARVLRDFLTKRLEESVPGSVSFVLYGREEL